MIRTLAILLAMTGGAFAQTACERPAIPPKLDQARLACGELKPITDEARAALAGCPKIWDEYHRLMLPFERCRAGEQADRLKSSIDDAVKSIPQR